MPGHSGVVTDTRGEGRALRATWHHEAGCLVLSVWRGNVCTGTVRVDPEDVPGLVEVLVGGLSEGYGPHGHRRGVVADAG